MKKGIITLALLAGVSAMAQENAKAGECPMGFGSAKPKSNQGNVKAKTNEDWWPNKLNLSVLRQHSELSNPMGPNFNYKKVFNSLDYFALKKDIQAILTQSQDWWPADFGN